MNRTSSISFTQLVDLAEGHISPEKRNQLLTQLAQDQQATALLAWLEHVITLMRNDDGEDAPDYVINRAIRLFRQRKASTTPNFIRRIIATLRFDSLQTPLAIGIRSGQMAPRQILFDADGRDLDLRINPSGRLWRIAGQVLGSDEGGRVELHNPAIKVQADLNDLSEFALPPVPAGHYTLTLYQADTAITINELEIGTSSP